MLTTQLIQSVNTLSDEQEATANVLEYLNDAMARINIRLKASLPYLTLDSGNEPIFPEKWQRALLIPFAVGRIKQQDSSQFEYSDSYTEFERNLADMAVQYEVPAIFLDTAPLEYEEMPGLYDKAPYGWNW
jgi:hypothetical protein